MDWPSQVHQGFAEKDGLKPEDFDYAKWPVSNVRIELPNYRRSRDPMPVLFKCDIDPATPQWNQYDANDKPLPDPTGIVLSRVKFQLVDADSYDVLAEINTGHVNGEVDGFLSERQPFWDVVQRGTDREVRLQAYPLFGYYGADGGMHAEYALQNRGYFGGTVVESRIYKITRTKDDELLLDGQQAPEAPPPPPPVYTEEELRLQADMEREHQRVERERREEHERMAKQQKEINEARDIIYARRGEYATTEEWLFGVLGDQSLDFGTVRKYVYRVADEVGFDFEEARKRRMQAQADAAAKRKAEYEKQQVQQRIKDDVAMLESMFEMYECDTREKKEALLKRIWKDSRFDSRFRGMANKRLKYEVVAGMLGIHG